jgi:tetratricopeptide (TPR) repeat protein
LFSDDKLIFKVEGQDSPYFLHSMILEALQDELSKFGHTEMPHGDCTIIEDFNYGNLRIPEYQFFLSIIRHTHYEDFNPKGNVNDVSNKKDFSPPTVDHIRMVMEDIFNLGVVIFVERGKYGYKFDDYKSNFWKNISNRNDDTNMSNSNIEAISAIRKGVAFYERKQYDSAIEEFKNAIDLDSNIVEAYINRGVAYGAKKQYSEAIGDLNKAIELGSNNIKIYRHRGTFYFKSKQFDESISDFSKAIEMDSKNADAYCERGRSRYAKGLNNEAVEDFSKAISLDPIFKDAYISRGWCYNAEDQFDNALNDFTKAIELEPNNCDAYYHRGRFYYENKKFDMAKKDLTEVLRLNPDDGDAKYLLDELTKTVASSIE